MTPHRGRNLPCVACHSYPWKRKHAKILGLQPLTECRPLCAPGPAGPAHSPLVFIGHKRQHLLLAPLVLLPPGPQTFPLEVVMLGITSAIVLLLPFLEVPSFFLGSVSLLCDKAQFAITICVTQPLSPHPHPRIITT